MYYSIQVTDAIQSVSTSIGRSLRRCGFLFIPLGLALAWLELSPAARAVDPPPDGGYPNENTAEGEDALFSLTTGTHNTAIGYHSLFANTTGRNNTASGWEALEVSTTGIKNTATGCDALHSNTTGSYDTANGVGALAHNTLGAYNTANGFDALHSNTTGSSNIALGDSAGINLTTGNNNIDIGNQGVVGEANTIRIGKQGTQTAIFAAGISGAAVPGGVGVIVDSSGHLGTVVSSAHYKDAIKPMDKASEAILALKPVTFRYKTALDPNAIPQFGLVAEDVEKVNPNLVAHDDQGKPYTVRYEAVNAMLLNEFLKEHRKVEEQSSHITKQDSKIQTLETTIAQQQEKIEVLATALKAQAAQIQKVSDQIGTQAFAPRVVADN